MYLADRARDHDRLPPPPHPPLLRDLEAGGVHVRRARLDGRAGPGHRLGRRPPQAPRAHRPRGRPPQPARRARPRRDRGCCAASGTPTSAGSSPSRAAPSGAATPRTSARTPACGGSTATSSRSSWPAWRSPPSPASSSPGRSLGAADRPALGRPRSRLLRPPRDLERQLGLPFPRHAALRGRRRVAQRLLARAALAGRGLAPQPPRLPPLGRARPAPLGARPHGAGHRRRWSGSGSPGTSSGSPRSANA